MLKHEEGLRKIIEKRVSQGKNYLTILKSMYGADPRDVWEVYKKYGQESSKKIGLVNLYPDLPEPHPAYSQWRITPGSTKIVLSKLINKNYKKICFLGCPVLGVEFSKMYSSKIVLLDVDKDVLNYAKKFTETILYNINNELPDELKNQFECVVCDPPWYYDDIRLFIKRAVELAKVGGTIYISLPSLLTKPSIISERLELQKWLSENQLIIAELYQIVEYEVPPFEYMAYQDIPAFSGEVWRVGDWLKLKKAEDCKISASNLNYPNWLEYSVGKKRIFLKERSGEEIYEKPELSCLYADKSLVLNSVSKRNPLIPKIDVWTSRNAVLHLDKGFSVVKMILENIGKTNTEIVDIISKNYKKNIEQVKEDCMESIELLRKLAEI